MQYFVILGKEGKIAKSLNRGLSQNKNKVVCLNWKLILKLISNKNIFEKYLFRNFNIQENHIEFKIINCLRENYSEKKFKDLHFKLLHIFKTFKSKVSYIFLSTYEANKFPHTKYRKIKNILENILIKKGVFIIRIGYYLDFSDLKKIKSNNKSNIITDMNRRKILVPCTVENDLIELLNEGSYINSKSLLISCYSRFYGLSGSLKYPFIKFLDLKKETFSNIMIPFKILSTFFFFIGNAFRPFGFSNNISNLLEKPYSLYLFQKIIYKSNN